MANINCRTRRAHLALAERNLPARRRETQYDKRYWPEKILIGSLTDEGEN